MHEGRFRRDLWPFCSPCSPLAVRGGKRYGTTAVCALRVGRVVYVAHAGERRRRLPPWLAAEDAADSKRVLLGGHPPEAQGKLP